jgi:hypothetical protein
MGMERGHGEAQYSGVCSKYLLSQVWCNDELWCSRNGWLQRAVLSGLVICFHMEKGSRRNVELHLRARLRPGTGRMVINVL